MQTTRTSLRIVSRATLTAAVVAGAATGGFAAAQGTYQAAQTAATAEAQQESDLRVIAARCGSPAFEKAFTRQSRAYVAAGRIAGREPARMEKDIDSMRRNPLVLVHAQADCVDQMTRLKEVQAQRRAFSPRPKAGR